MKFSRKSTNCIIVPSIWILSSILYQGRTIVEPLKHLFIISFGIQIISYLWFLLFPTGFSRQTVRFSDFILTAVIIFGTAFFFESLLNRNLGVLVFGLFYGLLIKMKTIYGR